jgi:hypothetical protein
LFSTKVAALESELREEIGADAGECEAFEGIERLKGGEVESTGITDIDGSTTPTVVVVADESDGNS